MRLLSAALALILGVLMLLAAVYSDAAVEMLASLGLEVRDREQAELVARLVCGALGASCSVASAVRFYQGVTDRTGLYEPYAIELGRVAGEFGRTIEAHPRDGLGFASGAEGVRVEVLVQPVEPGFVTVWMGVPARQRLMFLPAYADGADVDDADWRLVGRKGGWVLRAPMPSVARPLLADGGLLDDMTTLMEHPEVRAVRHDQKGVEVLSDSVPPERLQKMLRAALDVARRLRRVNG